MAKNLFTWAGNGKSIVSEYSDLYSPKSESGAFLTPEMNADISP